MEYQLQLIHMNELRARVQRDCCDSRTFHHLISKLYTSPKSNFREILVEKDIPNFHYLLKETSNEEDALLFSVLGFPNEERGSRASQK